MNEDIVHGDETAPENGKYQLGYGSRQLPPPVPSDQPDKQESEQKTKALLLEAAQFLKDKAAEVPFIVGHPTLGGAAGALKCAAVQLELTAKGV